MELPTTTCNRDGPSEQLPAPRVQAAISRWRYRMGMEELIRKHTTDTREAMKPVDRMMALLHGGNN
jgi:hypothetical protein